MYTYTINIIIIPCLLLHLVFFWVCIILLYSTEKVPHFLLQLIPPQYTREEFDDALFTLVRHIRVKTHCALIQTCCREFVSLRPDSVDEIADSFPGEPHTRVGL